MDQIKKPFLKYLRPLEWEDVFDFWRKNEAHCQNWIKVYKEREDLILGTLGGKNI